MKNVFISDIMTREPFFTKPDTDLLKCAKIMIKKRIGSLLLVYKKRLVGIISRRDILWALVKKSKEDLSKIKAIDISPKKIATIKPTKTVEKAFKKMKKLKLSRLPVIQKNKLVGLVTIKDILNFNPEIYPELNEYFKIEEEAEKLKRLKKRKVVDGICEECGERDLLTEFNGMYICESCRNSL